ncbi:hypothetical protein DQP57_06750 [Mycobacterium colombiense]|uniref:Uncharacterized protein n=1 Tax=Mycobacterium colombiense TaxID=339268 RepID=A0A329M5Z9_9MYCO|nr:hypothetical protein DQP57_06750 [Mycobacterium colombiense]
MADDAAQPIDARFCQPTFTGLFTRLFNVVHRSRPSVGVSGGCSDIRPTLRSLPLRNALAYKRLRRADPQDRARIPLAAWIDGILLAKTGQAEGPRP